MYNAVTQTVSIAAAGYGGVKGAQSIAKEVASSGKALELAGLPALTKFEEPISVPGLVWGKGIQDQGKPLEKWADTFLPEGYRDLGDRFPTFDRYNPTTQHAISIKTLDTNAKTYANRPSEITHRLKRYVNSIIDFEGRGVKDASINITKDKIIKSTILLGIPQNTTLRQLEAINRAIDYANLNGIDFVIKNIK